MPSLISVSESDPSQSAKAKECGDEIVVLDADIDIEGETVQESQTDSKDSQPSNPVLTKQSNSAGSSIENPIDCSTEAKESEQTEIQSESASSTTPNSKKRQITPNDDSGSKQKQQKKVNQMTLSSFFFKGRSNTATTSSTPSKTPQRKASSATKKASPPSSTAGKTPEKKPNEEKPTEEVVQIDVDMITGQVQDTSTPSEESNSSHKKVTGSDEKMETSTETEFKHGSAVNSVEVLATEPTTDTKPTTDSSSTNTINVLSGSVVKRKTRARPAKSRNTNANGKENNTRKAKQSTASAKKTKSQDSLVTAVVKKEILENDLPEESRALLQKYRTMKDRYLQRVHDVTTKHKDGLQEEDLGTISLQPITDDTELKTSETGHCEEFPSLVATNMALVIEGSNLPLSQLVSKICSELEGVHNVTWSTESVSAKVKLLSQRKAYFDPIKKSTDIIDLFEDNNQYRLWRWEVTTLDLLPSDVSSKARKARIIRKKISSYQSSLLKLVKSLEDTERQILDPAHPNLDKSKAKISRDEEKVLKFERDAEKQRLAEETKARKLREKLQEQEAKKKAREEALEAKRRQKEEAAEKKKEAAQARENEKRKKEEEKLQKEEAKKREEKKKQETFFKQKATFRSFFAAPKKQSKDDKKTPSHTCADSASESFNVEVFRSKINTSTDALTFSMKEHERSSSAKASRKRRTKTVTVSVYKTVKADPSEWGAPDYLEQTTIKVPNRYRFLSFHEDCRPAYRGTWSKKSSIVKAKNPFGKDSNVFDYEYDSEIEWEEGDDEMGENVEDDTKNQEEELDGEGNAKMYDYDDGFCVADDRLLDNEEDADEDTKALYKKKMLDREHEQHLHSNRIRIIAPAFGGVPLHLTRSNTFSIDHVEGFDTKEVPEVLSSFRGIQLSDPVFCLDPFPQLPRVEDNRSEANTSANANKDDYTAETMIALARFCHHSTHNSKDKLIEELRTLHPTLFSIRAKATRKLDAISIKKKHPKFAGVYWEVKKEILTELGLTDIMEKKVEDIVYDSSVKALPSNEEQKPNKSPKGKGDATKKKEAKKKSTKSTGSSSKKRKTTTKTKSDQKATPKKKAKATKAETPGSASKAKGKKETPKKEVISTGMKNIMAQFIKKSPVKTTAGPPKDIKSASSAQ